MAQAVEPERGAGSVTFEVERFEPRDTDHLTLSGRWFGLRGRRFVRPTLTLGTGDHRRRTLADFDHKPWAAEDGELWEASFPYERDGGDPRHIELTVAPDITVALPLPGAGASEQRIRARPRRDDLLDNLRGARRDGRPAPGSGNGRVSRRDGRSATGWEDGLEAQRETPRVPEPTPTALQAADGEALRLSQAQREIARLRAELTRREGALRERDRWSKERDRLAKERDRMAKERDRMAKERDQALRERDRALDKASKAADAAAARTEHRIAGSHSTARAMRSPGVIWAQRVLAISVLLIVVLAFAITARLA